MTFRKIEISLDPLAGSEISETAEEAIRMFQSLSRRHGEVVVFLSFNGIKLEIGHMDSADAVANRYYKLLYKGQKP